MDPKACLCDIFDVLAASDYVVAAAEPAAVLRRSLDKSGFDPRPKAAEALRRSSVNGSVRYVGRLTARKMKEE